MVGQQNLLKDINALIENDRFPKFSIIWGSKGSGKKTLCNYISKTMGYNIVTCPDTKVDTIRDIIEDSYKIKTRTLYILPHADGMSLASKNALLKVTEEPPNKAMFIMTLEDINNTLPTIRSRAVVFLIEPYSAASLTEYYKSICKDPIHTKIMQDICETPGDINYLNEVGADKFYSFVEKVVNNIALVNGANAFKIGGNLSLKENSAGYDLRMFFKAFIFICLDRYLHAEEKDRSYLEVINITSDSLRKCIYKSINKQMVFDNWILEVRGVWMNGNS